MTQSAQREQSFAKVLGAGLLAAMVGLPVGVWAQGAVVQGTNPQSARSQRQVVLSPELARDEAALEALTPEIVPGLKLPEEDSVVALDVFQGSKELVPLQQEGGDLNSETDHNVLKKTINPRSAAYDILELDGASAGVQMHTLQPVFYVRIGGEQDEDEAGGSVLTVDTHGATGRATPSDGSAKSSYVVERLAVRKDSRVLNSFRIGWLGMRPQVDVVEMNAVVMPGDDWVKLTPVHPLAVGEYALVEVLSWDKVNVGVWAFGVHPAAAENGEVIRPVKPRPPVLLRRGKAGSRE